MKKPQYEKALSEAGYDFKLKYNLKKENKTKKQKNESIMFQSTWQQKCGNESWSILFRIIT